MQVRGVQPMTKMSMAEGDDSFVAPVLEFEKIRFEHTVLVRFGLE